MRYTVVGLRGLHIESHVGTTLETATFFIAAIYYSVILRGKIVTVRETSKYDFFYNREKSLLSMWASNNLTHVGYPSITGSAAVHIDK
jgi:hypothetical protein